MSSTIISYTGTSSNGLIKLDHPIEVPLSSTSYVRLLRASISSEIPNVYCNSSMNNGLIRYCSDASSETPTWTNIQMPNGIYTIQYIDAAVASALSSLWANASDPGLRIRYNLATHLVYITIDNSKLLDPNKRVGIDLAYSEVWSLLGYRAVNRTLINTTNATMTFSADSPARLNWWGDSVSVRVDGLGPITLKNGSQSNEICMIPLSAATVQNQYIYPSAGVISPLIKLPSKRNLIQEIGIRFVDTRDGIYDIPILDGSCECWLELVFVVK